MKSHNIILKILNGFIGVLVIIMGYSLAYYLGFAEEPIMPIKYIVILVAVTVIGLLVFQPVLRQYVEKK